MSNSMATLWWVAAGILVAAELATGTFYLLMLALGLAAAAIAAHIGLTGTAQIVVAALVGGATTALWHWRRAQQPRSAPAAENRDVNLDIGEQVHVSAWSSDRSTRVQHRGTQWSARLHEGHAPEPGLHRIVAVQGNHLVLVPCPRGATA